MYITEKIERYLDEEVSYYDQIPALERLLDKMLGDVDLCRTIIKNTKKAGKHPENLEPDKSWLISSTGSLKEFKKTIETITRSLENVKKILK
jgi:hypothetical protein